MSEMLHVLIVEDMPTDAELCEREVRHALPECRFMRVETREDFLAALETFQPALIISDYKLPRFDGMAALQLALVHAPETPFLVLTGSMNEETAVTCMKAGAWDYVIKEHIRRLGPAVLAALEQKRVRRERRQAEEALREAETRYRLLFENSPDGVVILEPETARLLEVNETACRQLGYSREEFAGLSISDIEALETREDTRSRIANVMHEGRNDFETLHRTRLGEIRNIRVTAQVIEILGRPVYHCVWRDITEQKQAEGALLKITERLRRSLAGTVHTISMAAEARDPYTAGHQKRTSDLARAIAAEIGFSADRTDFIRIAAAIHDIGKIGIPAEILSKPKKLTDIEFGLIKVHPQAGYDILKDIEFSWPVAEVVLQHHERLDGSGYPRGLKGEEVCLEARILAVADVVDAMASYRPYRPALGIDAALEEISVHRGGLYDPTVADACLKVFRERGFKFV